MKTIRFKTEGLFNSFRIPFFRTYHKSFIAPPKTTIIGMLVNIMGESEEEFFNILSDESIGVSVVIDNISGIVKDLWSYKTFESKSNMRGRSVIRRDRLFNACYTIYLQIDNVVVYEKVLNALNSPHSVPALGLDDEIINIMHVEEIFVDTIKEKTEFLAINSVFMDKGYKYKVIAKDNNKWVDLPTSHIVPLKYKPKIKNGKRITRIACDEYKQVEFQNCNVEISNENVYTDGINRVVFY